MNSIKISELMQRSVDADLLYAKERMSNLVREMESINVFITIEFTRDLDKPGYKHILTAQISRSRQDKILAQQKKEQNG
jgi:hypothetical protein